MDVSKIVEIRFDESLTNFEIPLDINDGIRGIALTGEQLIGVGNSTTRELIRIQTFPDSTKRKNEERDFIRGDSNSDLNVNLPDAVFVLNFLFLNGRIPRCFDAVDGNDDGKLNISDSIYVLAFL